MSIGLEHEVHEVLALALLVNLAVGDDEHEFLEEDETYQNLPTWHQGDSKEV